MKRIAVSFIGRDSPGIIHTMAKGLNDLSVSVMEISQTILQSEFAAIVLGLAPPSLSREELKDYLEALLKRFDLKVAVRDFSEDHVPPAPKTQPFVASVSGKFQSATIAAMSGACAEFNVNIENLKAIPREDPPENVLVVFEVAAPKGLDMNAFRKALKDRADELGMDLSLQHRDIFEAMHRIPAL